MYYPKDFAELILKIYKQVSAIGLITVSDLASLFQVIKIAVTNLSWGALAFHQLVRMN